MEKKILLAVLILIIPFMGISQGKKKKPRYFYITYRGDDNGVYGTSAIGRYFYEYPNVMTLRKYGQCLLEGFGYRFEIDQIGVGITEMNADDYRSFFSTLTEVSTPTHERCDSIHFPHLLTTHPN